VIRTRLKYFGAAAAVLGMVCSMTSMANADEFTSDPATINASGTVKVWVVPTVEPGVPGDNAHNSCNIGSANGSDQAPHVTATVSSDSTAAVVSPSSLFFQGCGEANAQTFTVTLVPSLCNQTATITIFESERGPENSVKGTFSTETIAVSIAGTNPTDPSCTSGGGGGNQVCSEPAAPAWAAALLKATTGLKAKAKDQSNYISQVAQHMTQGAMFDGYAKSSDSYPGAVRSYMVNTLHLSDATLASVAQARAIRPGWTCQSVPSSSTLS
jgi:hypothetical protein